VKGFLIGALDITGARCLASARCEVHALELGAVALRERVARMKLRERSPGPSGEVSDRNSSGALRVSSAGEEAPVIPTLPFGRSGHASTRFVFGAAALWRASQAEADRAFERLLEAGVNHLDAAASYGDAELRIGPWMEKHRSAFFLATKTGERRYGAARDEIRRSLERLRTDHVDLIQLHNLVKEDEWELALGPDGALRACVEAREEGLARAIGVTGHGTRVAAMHLRSLERFDFDSVLLPYNPAMMRDPLYAADFERLIERCRERRVAVQTIKSVARRRWPEGATPTHDTWYEPLTDPDAIERAVHWALARPGVFVNSAGDLRLLDPMLRAAATFAESADAAAPAPWQRELEPLFVRGFAGT
jgi:aryl-alcohol dehydrogenase-like predicted oxidoreductase